MDAIDNLLGDLNSDMEKMGVHTTAKGHCASCGKSIVGKVNLPTEHGGQMAERVGNRTNNQKVAGSIPGRDKLHCVLRQGTSPYLPQGECPCSACKSL